MKKALSFLLALVMCLSLCACGGDENKTTEPESTIPEATVPPTTEAPPVIYKIGDEISTDAMKVVLLNVEFADKYFNHLNMVCDPVDDAYTFLVVEFSVQNIGKTNFGGFSSPNGGKTTEIGDMVAVNYDDGYIFGADDVNCYNYGIVFDSQLMSYTGVKTINNLKPLSEATTAKVAIIVPNQVKENTDAPLCIRFLLQNSNGDEVEVLYTIR